MENQEQKDGDKAGCSVSCKCCCGGKAVVALIAAAGVFAGGYFCGKHCARTQAAPAVSAPATK